MWTNEHIEKFEANERAKEIINCVLSNDMFRKIRECSN